VPDFRQVEDLVRDLRHAVRLLRRSPVFAGVAVLTLGLGIGAGAAVFALLDAAFLKPLPIARPHELVSAAMTTRSGGSVANVPVPLFQELRAEPRSFSGVFAFWQQVATVRWDAEAERVLVQFVTPEYYPSLGVRPLLGRLPGAGDRANAGSEEAVLGYRFWMRRFGADPAAIGQRLFVDGEWKTVVGVTPPEFFGTDRAASPDVTVRLPEPIRVSNLWVMGRLRRGVSLEEARAETALAWQRAAVALRPQLGRLRAAARDEILARRATLLPAARGGGALGLRQHLTPLRILALLSAVVLLIGCANLAGLLLARGAARSAELATRLAVGASRGRVVRQLLAESVLLSIAGGAAGLVFASWGHPVLARFLLGDAVPPGAAFVFDARVCAFALAASAAASLVFAVAPALRTTRLDLLQVLRGETAVSGARSRGWLARAFLVVQVAACVVLLVAAALLARTLGNLRAVDRGFSGTNLLLMDVGTSATPAEGPQVAAHYLALVEAAAAVPGVASASLSARVVFGAGGWEKPIWVQGRPADDDQVAAFNVAAPGFFAAAGLRLVAGRDFSPQDRPGTPAVAVVNEAFVRRYCPGGRPEGCRFGDRGPSSSAAYEVIGVVNDAKYGTLREGGDPMIYCALLQEDFASPVTLHVRAQSRPERLASQIRDRIRALDTTIPVYDVRTIEQQMDRALRQERMLAALSGFFAATALLLTSVGLFGTIACAVQRRVREVGLRIALGARRADVLRVILGETLGLVACGAAVGVGASLLATRLLASMLFGLSPGDPLAVGAAVGVLLAVALAAAYLPARRATRLQPMDALRNP
jgi:predicted permease